MVSGSSYLAAVQMAISRSALLWTIEPASGLEQPWIRVTPPGSALQEQGWKLHVTATIVHADEVLRRALEVLVPLRASFKVAGSPALLEHINQGAGGATQIGKFITVYPASDDDAVQL